MQDDARERLYNHLATSGLHEGRSQTTYRELADSAKVLVWDEADKPPNKRQRPSPSQVPERDTSM